MKVNGESGEERDVRVHFALVTDEASSVAADVHVGKESNGAINHSHRSDERKRERASEGEREGGP